MNIKITGLIPVERQDQFPAFYFAACPGWGGSGLENRWSERACRFESCVQRCDYGRLGNAADCGSALYGFESH